MGDDQKFGPANGPGFALPVLRMAPTSGRPSSLAFDGERFVPDYNDGSIEFEHIHRYVFAAPHAVDKDVLDVACGEGYGSDLLAQVARSVVGIDIDQASVDHASACYVRDNLQFMAAEALKLPLADASVDLCVSFETIEHLREQKDFLRELRRVLRPDGVLIISSPNREVYRQTRSENNRFHVKELTSVEFAAAVSELWQFSHVYKQDIVFGSLIVPELCPDDIVLKDAIISLDPKDRDIHVVEGGIAQCYSVVVASDVNTPLNGLSAYKGDYPDNPLPAMRGGIRERDAEVIRLHGRIEGLEREKAAYQDGCDERDEALAKLRERETKLLRERDAFKDGCDQRDAVIAELQDRATDLLRERDAFKDGCDQRDAVIAALQDRVTDLLRERDAFKGGCDDRDAIVAKLQERMAVLASERDALGDACKAREKSIAQYQAISVEQEGTIAALRKALIEARATRLEGRPETIKSAM